MKKISNLEEYKFTVDARDNDGNRIKQNVATSDAELFKMPLTNVIIGGREPVTRDVLKQIDRICDMLDEIQKSKKKDFVLEENDYRFLCNKFNQYPGWNAGDQIRKCILKAGDKLEKAEDYNPNASEKNKKGADNGTK